MRKPLAIVYEHLKSNRGSGLIIVLVTTLFIAALGATLLFTSYTGYLIKVSERGGKRSFYSASAAMDEIKIGVHQAVTESLATAYTDVLSEYTSLSADGDEAIQAKFAEIFLSDLTAWETDAGDPLFAGEDRYNNDTLRTFLSRPEDVEVSGGACAVTRVLSEDGAVSEIILEDINVSYTSSEGYSSSVITDINITMPDFHASTSAVASSGLPSYAIIARDELIVSSALGNRELTGNAYAGAVALYNNGNSLTYRQGTLICAGDAAISNHSAMQTNAGSEFWVGNITLGAGGAANLYGRTFVADDLTLEGNGSSAVLRGSYCGFGSGDSAGQSSAIVINGKNTSLDIQGLDKLTLAGVCFVDTTENSLRTGESISVKSNQLAYLIDGGFVSVTPFFDSDGDGSFDAGETEGVLIGSNPFIFTGDALSYSINTSGELWVKDGEVKTLADYGVAYNASSGTYTGVSSVVSNLPGTGGYKMAYFFLNFSSQSDANNYFLDFFGARPDKIRDYIGLYAELSDKAESASTAGNSLYSSGGELMILPNLPGADVAGRAAQFANRCQTLNPGKASAGDTPYSYYINEEAIVQSGSAAFRLPGNESIVARAVSGDYTITETDRLEGTKIIIATGNVTVNRDFTGLVIAGGDIILNADISYSPGEVQDIIYGAADGEGKPLTDYLLNTVAGVGGSTTVITSWDLDLLVYYKNWIKY